MEIIRPREIRHLSAALLDFDGTLSTLRCGWEQVMAPLMTEALLQAPSAPEEAEAARMVAAYIDDSAGLQTIAQMRWLSQKVAEYGGPLRDPWDYKAEYNRRLMLAVEEKKRALASGRASAETYLMQGAVTFLRDLRDHGVRLYVASGTDHDDVVAEARALGLADFFEEIAGAPAQGEGCSKEAVLGRLIDAHGLRGEELLVVGDGRVEIALGRAAGAHTIGVASDEVRRAGVNPVKRERLLRAGADVIVGDYLDREGLGDWLGWR